MADSMDTDHGASTAPAFWLLGLASPKRLAAFYAAPCPPMRMPQDAVGITRAAIILPIANVLAP